jgi:type I restriction enzyme, S subunit
MMKHADWEYKKLSDIADIRISNVDKKCVASESSVRLCNYMDVYSHNYITHKIDFMEASATAAEIEAFGLKSGDVMITKDSESPDDIGIPAVLTEDIDNLVCGYHLALIRPDPDQVDPTYLAKQLATDRAARYFANSASGSTRYGLSVSAISEIPIPIPSIGEQTQIAAILSTIDKAIAQTEAIIAKQQRIKAALMQDLLTRGIDEHGNIRSEETHAFKDSPLGRIPVEWAVGGILDFASRSRQSILTGPFGADLGANDFVDEGKPVLRIGNVQAGFFDLSDLLYVSEKKASELERYKVEPGDLLFARQGATTGRNALADKTVDGFLINYHIIRVAVDPERCVPKFLYAAFNSHVVQNQVDREKGRGTREGVSGEALKCFRLPIPPHTEQERISFVLTQHAAASHAQIETLRKFIKQKTALMQDLLTGKVRVTPLLEATGA